MSLEIHYVKVEYIKSLCKVYMNYLFKAKSLRQDQNFK
jgi:hypothetical protein